MTGSAGAMLGTYHMEFEHTKLDNLIEAYETLHGPLPEEAI